MPVLSKVTKPFTPLVRKFVKYRPYEPNKPPDSSYPDANHRANCVALQNDDAEEDAVVITALNVIPFCCHADLVTMTRDQLVSVAETLNEKLPLAMRIDTSAPRSDAFIRNSIELLVGIRQAVPPAPKPNRSMRFLLPGVAPSQALEANFPASPASPLANRSSRMNSFTFVFSPLTALDEGDEEVIEAAEVSGENVTANEPLNKKRKAEPHFNFPAVPPYQGIALNRSQSQRAPRTSSDLSSPPAAARLNRSQSQRPPRRRSIHRNITVTRGGRGAQKRLSTDRPMDSSTILTSTPEKRKCTDMETDFITVPISAGLSTSLVPPPKLYTTNLSSKRGLKRKASRLIDGTSDDITLGLEGMSMADEYSGSDMDVSSD